jgi:hypothetical protein
MKRVIAAQKVIVKVKAAQSLSSGAEDVIQFHWTRLKFQLVRRWRSTYAVRKGSSLSISRATN